MKRQPSSFTAALWLFVMAIGGCDESDLPYMPEVERVAYALEASWAGASAEDEGWAFTTDLGYDVVVDSWDLRTTSVELIPCSDDDSVRAGAFASSRPAYAHGIYDHDLSVVEGPWFEDLMSQVTLDVGGVEVVPEAYCEVFHAQVNLGWDSVSRVHGRYRAPQSAAWIPFEASTAYPITGLVDLGRGEWDGSLDPGQIQVRLIRHPVAAFDGVEFETMTPTELGFELAMRLAWTSSVAWWFGPEDTDN